MICGDNLRGYWEKSALKTDSPHSTAKIPIVQYCVVMSVIPEFLFDVVIDWVKPIISLLQGLNDKLEAIYDTRWLGYFQTFKFAQLSSLRHRLHLTSLLGSVQGQFISVVLITCVLFPFSLITGNPMLPASHNTMRILDKSWKPELPPHSLLLLWCFTHCTQNRPWDRTACH